MAFNNLREGNSLISLAETNCSIFSQIGQQVKETAYTAIVRPRLEYACAAWDPYLQKDINFLERVQRKAARFCANGYHLTASVTDMIRELGWQTLEQQRSFFATYVII